MARPNGNLEVVAPQIDAFAAQLGRGVIEGLRQRAQIEAETRRMQEAAGVRQEARTFDRETADLSGARQLLGQGFDVPLQAPNVERRLSPQRKPLGALGNESRFTRGIEAERRLRPVQLVPSDDQRRAELDMMGGGPLQPGPTVAQQVRPVAERVRDVFDIPLTQTDALGDFVPTRDAPGPARPDTSLERARIAADARVKAARIASQRPRGGSGAKVQDDLPLARDRARDLQREFNTKITESRAGFKDAVAARTKTASFEEPPTPEEVAAIEDEVAMSELESLAPYFPGEVIEFAPDPKTGRVPVGAVSAKLKELWRRRFDLAKAEEESKTAIKRLREPDAFPRATPNPAAGSTPPRNTVESAARAIAKERGIAWDRLNDPDMADKASEIMREAINRAATPQ